MYYLKKSGFTLVELIVVITILAILGTIWFISLQWYSSASRESVRISDLSTMRRSLELFHTKESFYPTSTNYITISYSGSLAWEQGVFWDETLRLVNTISEVPRDPLTKNLYAYSTSNTKQEFELGAISESPVTTYTPLIKNTYAANTYYANIVWNYNKKIVTVKQVNNIFILWVPTLITSEITNVTVEQVFNNGTFSIKNSNNLPASYALSLPEWQTLTWSVSFIPWNTSLTAPLIFSWSIEELYDDTKRKDFGEKLVAYYKNSNIANQDLYQEISSIQSWKEVEYANTLMNSNTAWINDSWVFFEAPLNTVVAVDPCYESSNIWTIGSSWACNGLLIVDRSLLQTVINSWYTLGGVTYTTSLPNGVFVGQVKDFSSLFQNKTTFNQNIWYWDMSQAENLSFMFDGASIFNQALTNWDTKNVTTMLAMFRNAKKFNQNISSWNMSKVTQIGSMFAGASEFNQPLNSWNISALVGTSALSYIFSDALAFNQPINNWNIVGATSLYGSFKNSAFNQDISNWNTSTITTMWAIFKSNINFNQNISWWNVSNVTNMLQSFNGATSFNQNISWWSVLNVTSCSSFALSTSAAWTSKPNFTNCAQ